MKNIAIVTGGDSSELVISLRSAEQVKLNLDPEKYRCFLAYIRGNDWHVDQGDERLPIDRDDFSIVLHGKKTRFDYAFIALHGPPGEDGQLQAYLDKLNIPYSTSGARSLELSFNKYASKEMLRPEGIRTPNAWLIKRGESFNTKAVLEGVGLPCFIKPNAGGSSFGVSRINRVEEFAEAVKKALEEDDELLVESFIEGTELTCGVLKTPSREFLFPVTEIISKNEFFDFEAKYTVGMADEITPANIPDDLSRKCQSISSRIYDLLDCRGIVRIDFIYREGELYFLELNGVPGMSMESILPQQIRSMGHTEAEIYNLIIEETAGW